MHSPTVFCKLDFSIDSWKSKSYEFRHFHSKCYVECILQNSLEFYLHLYKGRRDCDRMLFVFTFA